MERIEKLRKCGMTIFYWLVKGAGLVLLGLVLVIAIGEGPPNPFKLSLRELALMVSLLVSYLFGSSPNNICKCNIYIWNFNFPLVAT